MPLDSRLDQHARRLADALATRYTRRSVVTRVSRAALVLLGGRIVVAAIAPDAAQANHFCGHIWTTKSCPSPRGIPRVDRTGRPLRIGDGRPIDNLGRLVNGAGEPIDEAGQPLRGPDGEVLPPAPRTRICEDWVREIYHHHDARLQGAWYRCCHGQIRKLWDCCSHSTLRINGDAALHGYCKPGMRVFCVTYRDTGLPC